MLCSNRFPLPGSPSTCALDTAIVPLPAFFLLVALAANLYITRAREHAKTRIRPVKWLHIVYLVLLGAQIAMTILELVRLALEHLGVGLLPINTISLIAAWCMLWHEWRAGGRSRSVLVILVVYWFFSTIFLAIKAARLNTLMDLNRTTTKTSQYPSSDWFLDNAVMLGLYFLFFTTELSLALLFSRRRNGTKGTLLASDV